MTPSQSTIEKGDGFRDAVAAILRTKYPDTRTEVRLGSKKVDIVSFIGKTVGFTDKHRSERVGIIVRLNAKTASIAVNDTDGHWRVSYVLLRKIVDI